MIWMWRRILLITHDLGVVAEIADRVAVMYAGKIVEEASARDLFREPRHPYTAGLLRSMRKGGATRGARRLTVIEGSVPDLLSPAPGCLFAPRCPDVFDPCAERHPPLVTTIGPAARGPAASSPDPPADSAFRKVACFQFDAAPEAPRSPDGAGWDPERGR